ncbi:hypothetical protein ACHAQD_012442 [Fusarium lateritium]
MAESKVKNIYIALMGLTGAGKSSFINHCTKHQVLIGDGLQACTKNVEIYSFNYSPGITVHLVDTPGFDDTNRKDSDILRDISAWLSKSYTEKVLLNGILYLHRISDPRMQGSGKMSINLLIRLCGRNALKNVVLVTTMWEKVETEVGKRREKELESTEEFWGYMKRHGSQTRRHHNNEESARSVLSIFVPESPDIQPETVALAIQKELADDHKTLDQTGAGMLLDVTWAREKQALQRELEEVRDAVKTANEERDHTLAQLLQDQQLEMSLTVENMRKEQEKLRVTMEELHAERLSKYQQMLDEQMEISRSLSKDVESKAMLQKIESDKHEAFLAKHMEMLQERQDAVSNLQVRLDDLDMLSDTPTNVDPSVDFKQSTLTGLSGNVMSLVFSKDRQRIFAGAGRKKVWIYDRQWDGQWNRVQTLACCGMLSSFSSSSSDTIDCLVLSPDDSILIAACGSRLVRFRMDRHKRLFIQENSESADINSLGPVGLMALSSQGDYLAISGERNSGVVQIWNANLVNYDTSTQYAYTVRPQDVTGESALVTCFDFGPDDHLAIGLDNGTLCILEIGSDSDVSCVALGSFEDSIISVSWTQDGRILVGTETGLFLRSSDGRIKRVGSEDIADDNDCWVIAIDDDQIYYGTLKGPSGRCSQVDGHLIPEGGTLFPVAISAPDDVFKEANKDISELLCQVAFGGPGIVLMMEMPLGRDVLPLRPSSKVQV